MVIVSEQTKRKRRKQNGSVNAIVRGNGLVTVEANEAVILVVGVDGKGREETE